MQASDKSDILPSVINASESEIAKDIVSRNPDLNKLPENQKIAVTRQIESVMQFSGPIPPPAVLGGYEAVVPGLANRIVLMTENDLSHTHQMQKEAMQLQRKAQSDSHRYKMLGLVFAVLAMAIIAVLAGFFAWLGHPMLATGFGGVVLVGIVTAFINGQKKQALTTNKDHQANKQRRNTKNR